MPFVCFPFVQFKSEWQEGRGGRGHEQTTPTLPALVKLTTYYLIQALKENYKTKSTYFWLSNLPFDSASFPFVQLDRDGRGGGERVGRARFRITFLRAPHTLRKLRQPAIQIARQCASKEHVHASKRHAHAHEQETLGRASSKAHSAWKGRGFPRPSFAWSARFWHPPPPSVSSYHHTPATSPSFPGPSL